MSIVDAAAASGRSADMLYRIERDAAEASMETLDKLSSAYGCLIGDLLPNSGTGGVAERFEPLMAAMMGMDEDEIDAQILILASYATLTRNGINRRVAKAVNGITDGENSQTEVPPLPYTRQPSSKSDEPATVIPHSSSFGSASGSRSRNASQTAAKAKR